MNQRPASALRRYRTPLGARVRYHGPAEVSAQLDQEFHPFLTSEAGDSDAPDEVLVRTVEEPSEGEGWRTLVHKHEVEPDRILAVHDEDRVIEVVCPDPVWRSTQVARSIRNVLRWQHMAAGDLFLHGGATILGSTGLLVVGDKRAGKTTTMLTMMLRCGAAYVANDDVTVSDRSGSLTAYGWPRTVNVRWDSFNTFADDFPRLAHLREGWGHPTNAEVLARGEGSALGLWVPIGELVLACGVIAVSSTAVSAVVFPTFVEHVEACGVHHLTEDDVRTRLLENQDELAVKFDPFLREWFPHREARAEHLVDRLASSVVGVELRQCWESFPRSAASLRDLAGRLKG